MNETRLAEIYEIFSRLCQNKYTKENFLYTLEKVATDPSFSHIGGIDKIIDYVIKDKGVDYNYIANYLLERYKMYENYNAQLKGFKFNNSKTCCLAPYTTLNFDTLGNMRVCCYNNYFILGTYPTNTIQDAWNNPQKKPFIEQLSSLDFPRGCEKCRIAVVSNNSSNALFSKFDYFDPIVKDKPINFDFEFGTTCNYECIMCGGKWSSSIRKNRENLPPLKTPYDDEFIEQLKPFIPVMRVANFLGGEPFLTPLYYKIWELIKRINPKVQINITTNGSIFNSRVRDLLENLPQSKIVVSLDSVNEKNYNFIRKNGNFKEVMKNIDKFIEMDKLISIAFCPLIQNVTELPDIIRFCIDKNVSLYINMVTKPLGGRIKGIHENEHINKFAWSGDDHKMELVDKAVDELIPEFCLDTLSATQLQQIIDVLNQHSFAMFPRYDKIYTDFINSLKAYQSK